MLFNKTDQLAGGHIPVHQSPDSLSQRDRQAFAAELEKWWLEVQRSRG
nr:protein YaiI [uncultured bacterium]